MKGVQHDCRGQAVQRGDSPLDQHVGLVAARVFDSEFRFTSEEARRWADITPRMRYVASSLKAEDGVVSWPVEANLVSEYDCANCEYRYCPTFRFEDVIFSLLDSVGLRMDNDGDDSENADWVRNRPCFIDYSERRGEEEWDDEPDDSYDVELCDWCGREFVPLTVRDETCSVECRQTYHEMLENRGPPFRDPGPCPEFSRICKGDGCLHFVRRPASDEYGRDYAHCSLRYNGPRF